jgi:dihydrofolate synthase/folylpolyglutamate synthase
METQFQLSVLGEQVEIASPLVGRHQLRNLALAITAAEELSAQGFRITPSSIARGTRQTRWPGRFQRFAATARRPEIVLDVAHNPAGAWALRAALAEQMGERPLVLLFGAMADKAVDQIAQILWPRMAHVVLTRIAGNPSPPRSACPIRRLQTSPKASAWPSPKPSPWVPRPSSSSLVPFMSQERRYQFCTDLAQGEGFLL